MVLLAGAAQSLRPGSVIGRRLVRYVLLVVGGLMALMGGVWLLQGVGILPGSFMTGQAFWAVVGAIFLVVGGALVFAGFRLSNRR